MQNIGELIGALMQGGLNQAGNERLNNAAGSAGLGGAAGDWAANLFGRNNPTDSSAPQASVSPLSAGGALGELLGKYGDGLGSAAIGGALGGLVGGKGGIGGLAKGGAVAVLGMIAVNALKHYVQDQPAPPPQAPAHQAGTQHQDPGLGAQSAAGEDPAVLVIKAMINAAKADGQIDALEQEKIANRLREAGIAATDLTWVQQEINAPMDTDAIIHAVRDAQTASQIYAASLLAIVVDTPSEQQYMEQLAQGLGLAAAVRQQIHGLLGVRFPL